jgi:serpin B
MSVRGDSLLLRCLSVPLLAILASQVAAAQEHALTAAYNASAQDLFGSLAAAPGNIVISPYSIGTAMAMALSGARGETATQMHAVLKQTLPRSAMELANASVLATLNGYDKSAAAPVCPAGTRVDGGMCRGPRATDGHCPSPLQLQGKKCIGPAQVAPSAKLVAANALMLTEFGGKVAPDYAVLLKQNYAAEIFKHAQLDEINGWVKRKTAGKIDRILNQIDPSSAAILLNAVYFKAAWQSAFAKLETQDEAFHLTPTDKVQVPTMHQVRSFAVLARPGFQAIRLPYAVSSLSLIVVVPDRVDGVSEIASRLDAGELPQVLAAISRASLTRVSLALPRFTASFKADLVPPFQAAGMSLPFDRQRADFGGMTGEPGSQGRLKIGQIAHCAMIEVDETGTQAAGATAIEIMPMSALQLPQRFWVDRPFLFYLVDDASGAILFEGRISDPRGSRT